MGYHRFASTPSPLASEDLSAGRGRFTGERSISEDAAIVAPAGRGGGRGTAWNTVPKAMPL